MIRTYRYRCYLTHKQAIEFEGIRKYCCWFYNRSLSDRIEAYRYLASITKNDQQKELTHLRKHNRHHRSILRQFQQGMLIRVDNAYQKFFREKRGFPRFRKLSRFNSIDIPQTLNYKNNEVMIKGITGAIKLKGRVIENCVIKNATLKKDCYGWRLYVVVDGVEVKPLASTGKIIGIDVGINSFLTDSEGNKIENPRILQNNLKKLRVLQRQLSRRVRGSRRFNAVKERVRQLHFRIGERRRGFHWNVVHKLVSDNDVIVIEDLKVNNMVRNNKLSRAINDVSWGGFFHKLLCKAESAGKAVVKVNPHGTSQKCSHCGKKVSKNLSQRTHKCGCGLVMCRDRNAACNIQRAGITLIPSANVTDYCKRLASFTDTTNHCVA